MSIWLCVGVSVQTRCVDTNYVWSYTYTHKNTNSNVLICAYVHIDTHTHVRNSSTASSCFPSTHTVLVVCTGMSLREGVTTLTLSVCVCVYAEQGAYGEFDDYTACWHVCRPHVTSKHVSSGMWVMDMHVWDIFVMAGSVYITSWTRLSILDPTCASVKYVHTLTFDIHMNT